MRVQLGLGNVGRRLHVGRSEQALPNRRVICNDQCLNPIRADPLHLYVLCPADKAGIANNGQRRYAGNLKAALDKSSGE